MVATGASGRPVPTAAAASIVTRRQVRVPEPVERVLLQVKGADNRRRVRHLLLEADSVLRLPLTLKAQLQHRALSLSCPHDFDFRRATAGCIQPMAQTGWIGCPARPTLPGFWRQDGLRLPSSQSSPSREHATSVGSARPPSIPAGDAPSEWRSGRFRLSRSREEHRPACRRARSRLAPARRRPGARSGRLPSLLRRSSRSPRHSQAAHCEWKQVPLAIEATDGCSRRASAVTTASTTASALPPPTSKAPNTGPSSRAYLTKRSPYQRSGLAVGRLTALRKIRAP
jgi:hypothetical protein